MPTLVVTHLANSSLAGRTQRFERTTLRLGRAPDNDLAFDPQRDRAVSSQHAELSCEGSELRIRDLGSVNGTFVNGIRISAPVSLRPSDVVRFGEAGPELRVELAAAASAAPAKQGIGAATLQRAIDSATVRERQRSRGALGVVAVLLVVGLGGAGWFLAQRAQAERERQEAATAALASQQEELGAAVEESQAQSAEAQRLAREARDVAETKLGEALRRFEREMAQLETKVGASEGRFARLMVEIQERDRTLKRLQQRQDLSESQRQALVAETEQRLDDLRGELKQSEEELRKQAQAATQAAAAAGASAPGDSWEDLVARHEDALFLCVGLIPDSGSVSIGTGFAVRADGLLATNAHVVKPMIEMPVKFVIQNRTGKQFEVRRLRAHPEFTTPSSPDVGLIELEPAGQRFPAFPLADDATLRKVRIGSHLGTMGYPGELTAAYFRHFRGLGQDVPSAQATFKDGWVGRLLTYEGARAGFAQNLMIQHSASLSGGTSGSPMFNRRGQVVALNNSGLDQYVVVQAHQAGGEQDVVRTPSAAEIGYGIRVDVLRRFIADTGW